MSIRALACAALLTSTTAACEEWSHSSVSTSMGEVGVVKQVSDCGDDFEGCVEEGERENICLEVWERCVTEVAAITTDNYLNGVPLVLNDDPCMDTDGDGVVDLNEMVAIADGQGTSPYHANGMPSTCAIVDDGNLANTDENICNSALADAVANAIAPTGHVVCGE